MLFLLERGPLGSTKPGTSRTGISVHFFLAGSYRMAGWEKKAGVVTERMLGSTIFKGMKTNYAEPSTRANAFGDSPQGNLERLKFFVDRDPQGLERTSCGVNLFASKGGVNIGNQGGQVDGTLQGLLTTLPNNPCSDLSAQAFLAKGKQEVGNMVPAEAIEEAPGWFSLGRVESQVKRAVGMKTEASLVICKLVARETKVQHNCIHAINIQLVEDLRDMCKIRMGKPYRQVAPTFLKSVDGTHVTVQGNYQSGCPYSFCNRQRVASAAEGAIHDNAPLADRKGFEGFVQKDRYMESWRFHDIPGSSFFGDPLIVGEGNRLGNLRAPDRLFRESLVELSVTVQHGRNRESCDVDGVGVTEVVGNLGRTGNHGHVLAEGIVIARFGQLGRRCVSK